MSHPDLDVALRSLASATASPSRPLPDTDLIWRRAAARARWQQYEKATQSIRAAEIVACAACAATGIAAFVTLGPGIEGAVVAMNQTLVELGGMSLLATVAVAWTLIKALSTEE